MPVELKHLSGPTSSPTYSKTEKSQAFKAGGEAYRQGKTLEACPCKYKPVMGDSILFDSFRHGFLAASVAKLPQKVPQQATV